MSYYEITDRQIDEFYGEEYRKVRWGRDYWVEDEEDDMLEDEDDGEI